MMMWHDQIIVRKLFTCHSPYIDDTVCETAFIANIKNKNKIKITTIIYSKNVNFYFCMERQ